jgi:hypothetical protein
MLIFSILGLFIVTFAGYKFVHSRTYIDLKNVVSGDIVDVDIDMTNLSDGTFTFRIAHLLERNQYIMEHPKAMFLGAGLIAEDSKEVEKMFDFKVGLVEELTGSTHQVETSDISHSVLILRFGYLGTFLYLLLLAYLTIFFYKKKDNKYGLFSFLYLILTFGVSFFSANLVNPVNFVLPLISYLIIKKDEA